MLCNCYYEKRLIVGQTCNRCKIPMALKSLRGTIACVPPSLPHRGSDPENRHAQSTERGIPSQGIVTKAPDDSQNQSRIGENASPSIKSQQPWVVITESADRMSVDDRDERYNAGNGREAKCKHRQPGKP